MSDAPERIWLQDSGNYELALDRLDELTWCAEPQDDADTEYLRLDLHTAAIADRDARIAALEAEQDQLLSDSAIPSDQREKYEKLCGRLSVGKASQQEAIDAITALCRDNERLALSAGRLRAKLAEAQS